MRECERREVEDELVGRNLGSHNRKKSPAGKLHHFTTFRYLSALEMKKKAMILFERFTASFKIWIKYSLWPKQTGISKLQFL